MCCIPLLHRWIISYLPRSVIKNDLGLRWNQRSMSLSHSDIYWRPRSQEDISFIDHYGEFPNVPLLGIKGGITYNPSLAIRQFGYAQRDGPHDMLIQGIMFDYSSDLQGYHHKFIRAWGMVKKTDSGTLGRKNSIPLLYRWFISHLPRSVMHKDLGLRWSQRLMSLSLSHCDIHWCPHSQEDISFIDHCREFPNVPLLGIRGGITYNHYLALRQFGYARRDGQHDMLIQGIMFD